MQTYLEACRLNKGKDALDRAADVQERTSAPQHTNLVVPNPFC